MAKVCPCKDCVAPKRHPGCHARCNEYIEWNEEHQQELAKIREKNREYNDCFPTYQQQCRQQKKKEGWRKYGSHSGN